MMIEACSKLLIKVLISRPTFTQMVFVFESICKISSDWTEGKN